MKIKASTNRTKVAQTPTPSPSPVANLNKSFVWGAQGGAYTLNNLNEGFFQEHADLQIAKAKELGLNLIRANLEIGKIDSPFKINYLESDNDQFINSISSSGLDLLLVLDPNIPATVGKADYYEEGYRMGSYASKRYKGKVKYYQIANEISGTIVKKADTSGEIIKGENGIDYSQDMYNTTLEWIKGMSKGIRQNDPNAKIVLSGHWILYDIFPRFIADGADFDILGWSWYSSDGTDPTSREYNYGSYMNLAEKLKSIKKDVWLVETNASGGSKGENMSESQGEQYQAEFFSRFLTNVYSSGYFKGVIVYTLFDNPVNKIIGNENDSHFGLVGAEIDKAGKVNATKNKPAFEVYKKFIAEHQ